MMRDGMSLRQEKRNKDGMKRVAGRQAHCILILILILILHTVLDHLVRTSKRASRLNGRTTRRPLTTACMGSNTTGACELAVGSYMYAGPSRGQRSSISNSSSIHSTHTFTIWAVGEKQHGQTLNAGSASQVANLPCFGPCCALRGKTAFSVQTLVVALQFLPPPPPPPCSVLRLPPKNAKSGNSSRGQT